MSKKDWGLAVFIAIGILIFIFSPLKKRRIKRIRRKNANTPKRESGKVAVRKKSKTIRSDASILNHMLGDLSEAEFKRLLTLYFRDQGYTVKKAGVGESNGGVDLIITDKRGKKTAVLAVCNSKHNSIPIQTIREFVAVKNSLDCIFSLLVTTSDLTLTAKKEAEQCNLECWYRELVEQKLRKWEKWQPSKKRRPKTAMKN